MSEQVREVPVSCNKDCGAGCPLIARVVDGRIVEIFDNPRRGPMMRGCARGRHAFRGVYAPDRIRAPLIRNGPRGSGEFRAAEWDEALDLVADRLRKIVADSGPESVMRLGGSGGCRGVVHNTAVLTRRFLSGLGGYTDTQGGYSSQATSYTTALVYGTQQVGVDPATLRHSRLLLLWGANIVDTRFGCETESWIRDARRRGIPIIVIDPRRSRTVERLATTWIPILPGTDAVLMMALLYCLIEAGHVDASAAARLSVGFDAITRRVTGVTGPDGSGPCTPEWAEALCDVPAATIRRLASLYGQTKPAALLPGLSIQRTLGGEETTRLAVALQVATGNIGVAGGSSGVHNWGRLPQPRIASMSTLGAPSRAVPVYRWADAAIGDRGIRALFNVGGNYLTQGSDYRKGVRAFAAVDFAVCSDMFLTPTAGHCDVVLPVASFLERADVVRGSTNHLFYSTSAVAPLHKSRTDYDILAELAHRLGFGHRFTEGRTADQWVDALIEDSEIRDHQEFRRTGIFDGGEHDRVALADFRADPETHRLPTPSGKIELVSATLDAGGLPGPPEPRTAAADRRFPLAMVTPHARYRINSQNWNIPWFRARDRQDLWINPTDAGARGLCDGDLAEVHNDLGRVRVPVRVTEAIRPGVVCLEAGAWPRMGSEFDTAGSPNLLTSTEPTEPSKGSRTHSVSVEVARAAQD